MSEFELIKNLFVFTCLLYASYTDIKKGEASNKIWCILGLGGILFCVIDFVFIPLFYSVIAMSVVMFIFYHLQWFAGADVKAMLCLSILYPHFTNTISLPLLHPLRFSLPILPFPNIALNILLFSLLSGALYAVLLGKKRGIAFLPHITVGWVIVLIIESFL